MLFRSGGPIGGKAVSRKRKNVTGKMRDAGPRQNEETAVIDYAREVGLASGIVPTDELIPRSHAPGGASEQQGSQWRQFRLRGCCSHKIAQLRAEGSAVSEVMMELQILAKELAVGGVFDEM